MSFFATSTFTLIHVALSLIGIIAGLGVLFGLLRNNPFHSWTFVFLLTTVATTLTGFLFPFRGFTPALGTGIVSSLVLAPALLARYTFNLAGAWRRIYVVGAIVSLYLNCFVLVVQAFLKVPALNALAPEGKEPPFVLAQGVVLVLFVIAGILAVRRARGSEIATPVRSTAA